MSARTATVACCQVPLDVGDPQGNRRVLLDAITDAADRGADIVVLPELARSGYRFESTAEARAASEDPSDLLDWVRIAAERDLVVVGGFVERSGTQALHNSAALVDPTGVRAVYRKVHLWDREGEWFEPGAAAPPVVETRFGRVGVLICYDVEFPEWVRLPALAGAEILCAPINWPLFDRPPSERPAEIVRVQADAAVNRVYIAACDRTRRERGTDWLGGSVIVDPDGFPVSGPRLGEPATIMATVDLDVASDKAIGDRNDVFADRRPDLYGSGAGGRDG